MGAGFVPCGIIGAESGPGAVSSISQSRMDGCTKLEVLLKSED